MSMTKWIWTLSLSCLISSSAWAQDVQSKVDESSRTKPRAVRPRASKKAPVPPDTSPLRRLESEDTMRVKKAEYHRSEGQRTTETRRSPGKRIRGAEAGQRHALGLGCAGATGDCCSGHAGPACEDLVCCTVVCNEDPFCCEEAWDDACADIASDQCGVCGGGNGDECSGCIAVLGNTQYIGSTVGATGVDESSCAGGEDTNDMWHCWVSECVGEATISLCSGSDFDTSLAVYEGGCGGPEVACNDDNCPGLLSELNINVLPGELYAIRVAGFGGQTGNYTLDITCTEPFDGCIDGNGDCCTANESGGCEDTECCQFVCEQDVFCCDGEWDDACADLAGEVCVLCGGTIPGCVGTAGDCCINNGSPGCEDGGCCAQICTADPFCCDTTWDDLCADAAELDCAVCQPPEVCFSSDGDCCEANAGPGCSDTDCCDIVCAQDVFCCEEAWDDACADVASEACVACGGTIPECVGTTGDCCTDNGTPGCEDGGCCAVICAADPFCCETTWDGLCADAAEVGCPLCFPPEACLFGVGDCCAPQDSAGCGGVECCDIVCDIDPFCCEEVWDDSCADLAVASCSCNDLCEQANEIFDGPTAFTTVGAVTDGPAEPDCNGAADDVENDVWYDYTATCTGVLVVDTCGTAFDTALAVYDGCECPVFQGLGCDDDDCETGGLQSMVEVDGVLEGNCYKVRVGAFAAGVTGDGTVNILCDPYIEECIEGEGDCCEAHGNGGCDDPECCDIVCTQDAFCCDGEWDDACADVAGEVCLACGGTIPECVGTGGDCCVANGSIGCEDGACCAVICAADPFCCETEWDGICAAAAETECEVCFPPQACLDGTGDCCVAQEGPGCGGVECCDIVCDQDPFCCEEVWDDSCADLASSSCACNDECPQADPISDGLTPFSNIGASNDGPVEAGCVTANNDVWFDYTSTCTGVLTVDTCTGSDFDTVLAVYDGCECPSELPSLDCNDDDCGLQSLVAIDGVVEGGCYKVRVGSFGAGASGMGSVNVVCEPYIEECIDGSGDCCEAHGNGGCDDPVCCDMVCSEDAFCCEGEWDDACADVAGQVCLSCGGTIPECVGTGGDCCEANGTPGCDNGSCCADICTADPFCCATTWDQLCADAANIACAVCIAPEICFESNEACLEPHDTPACENPACCGEVCNEDTFCCDVEWDEACVDIANDIASCQGGGGNENDNCADAEPVTAGTTFYDSTGMTDDGPELPEECDEGFGLGFGSDLWYAYTPGDCGAVTLSLCEDTVYDSRMAVYEGCDCPTSNDVLAGCDDDGCGTTGGASSITLDAVAGTCYLVRIGGFNGATGAGALQVVEDFTGCSPCPDGDVTWMTPVDGVVDARQPHPVGSLEPQQGIDTFDVAAPAGAAEECWSMCETSDGGLGANSIVSAIDNGDDTYTLTLSRPITAGQVTTITYNEAVTGTFTSHPSNVNGDGAAGPLDILAIIDYLNAVDVSPFGTFSEDIDQSGLLTPTDILAVIDLLNGADTHDVWNNTNLPENTNCP